MFGYLPRALRRYSTVITWLQQLALHGFKQISLFVTSASKRNTTQTMYNSTFTPIMNA